MATALLFDRDRVDEVADWTDSLPKVGRSAILWIDLENPDEDEIAHLVDTLRDTRESIVGSFDVLLPSTGQRTNEIVKVLTLASVVLLLPGALIAGVMGMNFKVGIFETAAYFWVVIGIIVAVIVATLAVARAREWI